ncbi:MAG TPA: ATP-binding protein [Acidimicrobiales bacterium]|nr:ATP-binding protein [Acidimicrobiales bacterium]
MNLRRVRFLTAGQVLVAVALIAAIAAGGGHVGVPGRVAALAAAFAVVGFLPMHLELGRSAYTVTLGEAVLIVALFAVGPLGVAAAACAGEIAACLVLRLSLLKIVYNAAMWATAPLIGALTFAGLGGSHLHATRPVSWLAALVAVGAFAAYNFTATALVQSLVEDRRLIEVAKRAVAVAMLSSLLSASLGLITLVMVELNPAAPVLLLPLVVIAAFETRRAAGHQSERLRFERLYAASGRTTGLDGLEQALARSALEARNLVTGVAAVCCVSDPNGGWTGMLVDDDGERPVDETTIATVVSLIHDHAPGEVSASVLGPALRQTIPPCATIVLAGDTLGANSIALAVFREPASNAQGHARAEVLAAFVGHAALTAANAVLYAEVQDALAHQVDLNRQKDEFAAAVSHELRTPLAAMLTSIGTLRRLEGRLDPQSTGRVLELADRQGKRLHRLIDELLTLAAIEQSSAQVGAEPTDVAAIVDEVADDLRRLAPNTITAHIDDNVGTVSTSPARLRQILTNLIENAVKYGGGSTIEVVGRRDGEQIILAVVDHGDGISQEDASRVFERFTQLDQSATRRQGGTGLGLYLCRKIAEVLDGTLTLTPTTGGGATFTLSSPGPRLAVDGREHESPSAGPFAHRSGPPSIAMHHPPILAAAARQAS